MNNFRNWIDGLIGAIVGGGANAITIMIVDPQNFNFQDGWKKLWQFTAVSAVVSAALYLRQKPIPQNEKPNTPPVAGS